MTREDIELMDAQLNRRAARPEISWAQYDELLATAKQGAEAVDGGAPEPGSDWFWEAAQNAVELYEQRRGYGDSRREAMQRVIGDFQKQIAAAKGSTTPEPTPTGLPPSSAGSAEGSA